MMYYMFKNVLFWAIVILSMVSGSFHYYRKGKSHMIIVVMVASLGFGAAFEYGLLHTVPNLVRREVWNGKIKRVVHEEEYTIQYKEKYTETYKDSKGNTKTRTKTRTVTEHIPNHYYIESTVGKFPIDRTNYVAVKSAYGETITVDRPYRAKQVSWGDGRIFTAHLENKRIPIATYNKYVNHMSASDTSLYAQMSPEAREKYTDILPQYYDEKKDVFGNMRYDRVKDSEGVLAPGQERKLQDILDNYLIEVGSKKQCNIITVFTKQDEDYYYGLLDEYKMGNKNDILIVVGVGEGNSIEWANISAYTDEAEFIVNMKNDILDMNTLDLAQMMTDIMKNVDNSYIRRPMAEMSYLSANIYIPSGKQSLFGFLAILVIMGTCLFVENKM